MLKGKSCITRRSLLAYADWKRGPWHIAYAGGNGYSYNLLPEKLQIVNGSEIYISSEEDYDIVVDLEGHTEEYESLKPFIAFIAQNICELDNTAQKFNRLHSGESQFPFDLEIVFIDDFHVILEYWGTEVNTQFDVFFEYSKDKFTLKKFGMIQDIPADWEQAAVLKNSKSKQAQKKSFLHRIIHWM